MWSRRRILAALAVTTCTVAATVTVSSPSGEAARQRVLFGAYVPPAPESGMAPVADLEASLGRRIEIVLWYQHWAGWGPDFNAEWTAQAASGARRPLLTWEPWKPGSVNQPKFRLKRIAEGAFDPYITTWARAIKAYGRRLYLRPMHEMNGNWYPWGGTVNRNTPRTYVAAWRRMHRIFENVGATNVRWVWSPYAMDVPAKAGNRFENYYPGRRYVDILALDGYNWGGDAPEYGGWKSFRKVFRPAYKRIVKLGPQPVWIAETASNHVGGNKARWVRRMFATLPNYPRIRAVIWFHTVKERDWRATNPARVAAAFAP
jgi:hypothetical protein